MQKENPDIELLCKQIEKSLNWGPASAWREYDFEELSEKIHAKTEVLLSVSTLKRIWGRVRYESSPTIATLNALAKFLDFKDWRDFLKADSPAIIQHIPANALRKTSFLKKFLFPIFIIFGLLLISIGLISLLGKKQANKMLAMDFPVKFESRMISDGLPNSVVFDYDASAYHSDSVYIQQNWDPRRRERVPGNGKQHTSIYYYPGFFKAKLIVDGQIKKESDVFIKSNGWVGIVGEKPVPVYLSAGDMYLNGVLGISAKNLSQKTGNATFQDQWVYFTNVREFKGVDPFKFDFSISLRNSSSLEESPCRKVKIYLLGTESAIIIPLAAKGCTSDIELLTADSLIAGKDTDLSAFGSDFRDFQQLSCLVDGHRLKIYLNDRLIWNEVQQGNIGDIIGLRIGFEGAGEIRTVRFSEAGKILYEDQFHH